MQGALNHIPGTLRPRNGFWPLVSNKTFRVQENSFPGAGIAKQQPDSQSRECVRVDVDRGLIELLERGAADVGDTGRKQSTQGRDCTGSVNCRSESRGCLLSLMGMGI